MAPTKVFVGNLSFKTREAELAQEFAAAGKVLTANIITRGPRSLGYGFVELESEEEANKAVDLLNKKEIDGRAINVEVARPRVDRPEGEVEDGAPPRRNNRGRGSGRRGRGRGGQPREPNTEGGQPAEAADPAPPRQPRRRRGGGAAAAAAAPAEHPTEGGEQPAEGRRRAGRPRRGGRAGGTRRSDDGPREESDTTLFVANLPFSLTDEQLKTEFSSGGTVKSAHVVVRVTGRSKGYGFVEYETKEDQVRALSAFEKKEIEGRALIVKVALKDSRPAPDAAGEVQPPQQ